MQIDTITINDSGYLSELKIYGSDIEKEFASIDIHLTVLYGRPECKFRFHSERDRQLFNDWKATRKKI